MHSPCLQWMKELLPKTANCPLHSQHGNREWGERQGQGADNLQRAYDPEYLNWEECEKERTQINADRWSFTLFHKINMLEESTKKKQG